MTRFEHRLALALAHEHNVLTALRHWGWDAEPFGQAQLSTAMREHLRRYTPVTPVRWMPDIIAARQLPRGLTRVVYVDAKAGEQWQTTGNHDVETAAVDAAEGFEAYTRCPVYFVFTDYCVTTQEEIREFGTPGPQYGNGSGTPYLLFPRGICSRWDDVFGAVPQVGEGA